jgi:hypothetical protein
MRWRTRKIKIECNPRTLKKAIHWYRQEIQAELRAENPDSWRKGDPEKVALHDELLEIEQKLEDLLWVD